MAAPSRRRSFGTWRSQSQLIWVGVGAWVLLGVLFLGAIALHQWGVIQAWRLPLGPVAMFLGGGGLRCLAIASLWTPRWKRQLLRLGIVVLVGLNAIAFRGAYAATHDSLPNRPK